MFFQQMHFRENSCFTNAKENPVVFRHWVGSTFEK